LLCMASDEPQPLSKIHIFKKEIRFKLFEADHLYFCPQWLLKLMKTVMSESTRHKRVDVIFTFHFKAIFTSAPFEAIQAR